MSHHCVWLLALRPGSYFKLQGFRIQLNYTADRSFCVAAYQLHQVSVNGHHDNVPAHCPKAHAILLLDVADTDVCLSVLFLVCVQEQACKVCSVTPLQVRWICPLPQENGFWIVN